MNEAKVCAWEYENDNASSMAMMELAGLILIGDAIRESTHTMPPEAYLPFHQIMSEEQIEKLFNGQKPPLRSNEPDGTGYYWAVFPDGSARLVEIEEADPSKKGVKCTIHLLDWTGELMEINEAKWIKISPQP
jgi:hypothetical protein